MLFRILYQFRHRKRSDEMYFCVCARIVEPFLSLCSLAWNWKWCCATTVGKKEILACNSSTRAHTHTHTYYYFMECFSWAEIKLEKNNGEKLIPSIQIHLMASPPSTFHHRIQSQRKFVAFPKACAFEGISFWFGIDDSRGTHTHKLTHKHRTQRPSATKWTFELKWICGNHFAFVSMNSRSSLYLFMFDVRYFFFFFIHLFRFLLDFVQLKRRQ